MSRLHLAAPDRLPQLIVFFLILASIALLPSTPARSSHAGEHQRRRHRHVQCRASRCHRRCHWTGIAKAGRGRQQRRRRVPTQLLCLPGTYTITFELPGFQSVKREGVRLAVGFTATIDQSLSLGSVEETITVSGVSPLVDVTNPSTSVDLSSDGLEVLPTTRDGLKAFMAQVPGMRTNLDVGASSMTDTIVIRAYGQQGAPWQMLEGIMFASSGGNGVQGAHVDFNAIESTRLQTVGSSAEMPRRGPFIDSVAKSGGNQMHGELVAYGSSDSLEAENVDDELTSRRCQECAHAARHVGLQRCRWGQDHPRQVVVLRVRRSEGYNREILNAFYDDGSPILDRNRPAVPHREASVAGLAAEQGHRLLSRRPRHPAERREPVSSRGIDGDPSSARSRCTRANGST